MQQIQATARPVLSGGARARAVSTGNASQNRSLAADRCSHAAALMPQEASDRYRHAACVVAPQPESESARTAVARRSRLGWAWIAGSLRLASATMEHHCRATSTWPSREGKTNEA